MAEGPMLNRDFDCIRQTRIGRFIVRLYDLQVKDNRGSTALGYRISKGREVLAECYTAKGAVYHSPLHAADSIATLKAAVGLICHVHSHDSDDNPVDCRWATELEEEAYARWEDF